MAPPLSIGTAVPLNTLPKISDESGISKGWAENSTFVFFVDTPRLLPNTWTIALSSSIFIT